MVFVRKINDYYVLVHSVRKGKKVVKESKYIGKKLPSKVRLEQLKKEFLKEIKGERYKFFSAEEIELIEKKKKRVFKWFKKIEFFGEKKVFEEFHDSFYL
ncbi:MAG: hypothetical protein ABIA76_04310 [Candidatus Diapherotrites archaeon]